MNIAPRQFPRHERMLLIRPEFLNHGGTLTFVTKLFGPFDFKSPARGGDIVRLLAQLESTGTTSCRIGVWAENARTGVEVFRTFAVMVNVKSGRKTPLPPPAGG